MPGLSFLAANKMTEPKSQATTGTMNPAITCTRACIQVAPLPPPETSGAVKMLGVPVTIPRTIANAIKICARTFWMKRSPNSCL